jgi:Asp-tRNA(Asn)/Glu-tRNA(Gln) amidotransferase A subunit family amidase
MLHHAPPTTARVPADDTRRRFMTHFAGQPTNVVFYGRPFGEMDVLALAKAYQDAAGFHLKNPTRLVG